MIIAKMESEKGPSLSCSPGYSNDIGSSNINSYQKAADCFGVNNQEEEYESSQEAPSTTKCQQNPILGNLATWPLDLFLNLFS